MNLVKSLFATASPRPHFDALADAIARTLPAGLPRHASTPQALGEHRNELDARLESGRLRGTPAMAATRAARDACDRLAPVLRLHGRIAAARDAIVADRERFERAKGEAAKDARRAEQALAAAQRAAVQPEQRLKAVDEALERMRSRGEADIAAAAAALDEALLAGVDEADVQAAAGLHELRRKLADDGALLEVRRDAARKVRDTQAAVVRQAEEQLAAARRAEAAAAVQFAQLEADAAANEFVASLLPVVREALAARAAGETRAADSAHALASLRVLAFDTRRVWFGSEPDGVTTTTVATPHEQLLLLARLLDGPPLDVSALLGADAPQLAA